MEAEEFVLHCLQSQFWIARELCVRQARAPVLQAIGVNRVRRRKQGCAARGNKIVLIHSIAAHPNRPDQHPIAIQRKSTGKDRHAIRQIRIGTRRGHKYCSIHRVGGKDGRRRNDRKSVLQAEEQTGRGVINPWRVSALGKETHRARRKRAVR